MRQPLVAGNWKMHGSRKFTHELVGGILAGRGPDRGGAEVVVCPPFTCLDEARRLLADQDEVVRGAQDVDWHDDGAYTGEVSASRLADAGCRYVIVGHSERRALYGETDAVVARKAAAARERGLTPILCVGETLAEREANRTEAVVGAQIDAAIEFLGADAFADMVIAYEPVWAIGTGRTATGEQAQAVHAFIRARIAGHDPAAASAVRIVYGGSVKPDNAQALFVNPDIDGGLIGGASLKAADFLAICNSAG